MNKSKACNKIQILSTVIDLYMKWLKKQSIDSFPLNPQLRKIFVANTYIIWPHGKETLDKFKDLTFEQSS
jgi:hypothetical protein